MIFLLIGPDSSGSSGNICGLVHSKARGRKEARVPSFGLCPSRCSIRGVKVRGEYTEEFVALNVGETCTEIRVPYEDLIKEVFLG